jgi:glycosyltransferase involved in cell wall biosynthesis
MTTYARYRSGLLQAAVQSVLSQDFQDFEFIIHDDASIDGSAGYLRDVATADRRVRVLQNSQNINSVAISLGRCLIASDPGRPFISWMFDDCVLLPGALAKLASRLRQSPVDVLFGVTDVHLKDGGILQVGSRPPEEIRREVAKSSILVPNAGILIRREVFDRVGWYDPNIVLRRSCDWDLFRRIFSSDVSLGTVPDVLVEEYGEMQMDSLRNSFVTTFDIMSRFTSARDATGLKLDVKNCLNMPMDWIPPGNWTGDDIAFMQFMFLEYFISVGDIPRALRWAKQLEPKLDKKSLSLSNLRAISERQNDNRSLLGAGAYCGVLLGMYRQVLEQKSQTTHLACLA